MTPISRRRMSSAACSASSGSSSRADDTPRWSRIACAEVTCSCSAMKCDAERDEAVDQVQARQLLAEQEQYGAVDHLDHDERLAGAQQRPERAAVLVAAPLVGAEQAGREVDDHDARRRGRCGRSSSRARCSRRGTRRAARAPRRRARPRGRRRSRSCGRRAGTSARVRSRPTRACRRARGCRRGPSGGRRRTSRPPWRRSGARGASWPAASTLTPKRLARWTSGSVRAPLSKQTSTSTGSRLRRRDRVGGHALRARRACRR